MKINEAIKDLGRPEKYGPTVAGGAVGIFGSSYALATLQPYVAQYGDAGDWALKGGWTAAMIVGMMSVKPGGEGGKALNTAIHTAFLTGAVTGIVVLVTKAMGWGPVTIGRVGASPGLARGGVRVVNKTATPTYAQATPVVMSSPTPSDVIQAF